MIDWKDLLPKKSSIVIWIVLLIIYFLVGGSSLLGQNSTEKKPISLLAITPEQISKINIYVGGKYNTNTYEGYPIIALKYGRYTLEHAVRGPDNMYPIDISGYSYNPPDYWKIKIQNPFGLNKVAFEIYQKHDVYSLKGFMQIK